MPDDKLARWITAPDGTVMHPDVAKFYGLTAEPDDDDGE